MDDDDQAIARIARLIDDVQPDTILTFGLDGMTSHTDHIAVHHWVTAAWTLSGCRARLLYATTTTDHVARFGDLYVDWNMSMSDQRPTGVPAEQLAVHVVLEGAERERKLAALRSMSTQTGSSIATIDPEVYAAQVAEEAFIEVRPVLRRPDRCPSDRPARNAAMSVRR